MATGLRERRKQEARQAISAAAMGLFEAHGFDAVTISQVADAAGVSKMTVTNYFQRKEDLVFDRAEAIIGSLAGAAAARAPGESLLAAVRRDYAGRMDTGGVPPGRPAGPEQPRARQPGPGDRRPDRAGARRRDRRRGGRGRPAAAGRRRPARVGLPGAVRGGLQADPGRPAARRGPPGAGDGRAQRLRPA